MCTQQFPLLANDSISSLKATIVYLFGTLHLKVHV